MSQLIFAQAKTMLRKAKKYGRDLIPLVANGQMTEEERLQAIENHINIDRKEFKEILQLAALLHDDYCEVMKKDTRNWYFITIRPDQTKITFRAFYDKCKAFVHRAFITEYTLSFEQKGTDDVSLGHGFHAHIVCKSTARSKGEVLRYTQSTFGTCAANNCIQVDTTRTPETIIDNYLVEYVSEDNHKIVTKEFDEKWRKNNNIKGLYKTQEDWDIPSVSIKSNETERNMTIEFL